MKCNHGVYGCGFFIIKWAVLVDNFDLSFLFVNFIHTITRCPSVAASWLLVVAS